MNHLRKLAVPLVNYARMGSNFIALDVEAIERVLKKMTYEVSLLKVRVDNMEVQRQYTLDPKIKTIENRVGILMDVFEKIDLKKKKCNR